MRAIGYIRVSTDEQAQGGVSLDAQRAKLEAFCALHDLVLVGVEVDAGLSAKTLARPGLESALSRLDRGEADGLAIAKLDRLTRSVRDWAALIEGYFGPVHPAGKSLWSVGDSIDTTTAGGRLVLNILMTLAQWERETIGERTRDALRHKRSVGERVGSVPRGTAPGRGRQDPGGRPGRGRRPGDHPAAGAGRPRGEGRRAIPGRPGPPALAGVDRPANPEGRGRTLMSDPTTTTTTTTAKATGRARPADLAEQLRRAIAESGLSAEALARALGVGARPIQRFLARERDLRLATAAKVASALGLRLIEGARPARSR